MGFQWSPIKKELSKRKFASEGNSETRGVESIGNCCNNCFGMHDTIILLPSNDYDGK